MRHRAWHLGITATKGVKKKKKKVFLGDDNEEVQTDEGEEPCGLREKPLQVERDARPPAGSLGHQVCCAEPP